MRWLQQRSDLTGIGTYSRERVDYPGVANKYQLWQGGSGGACFPPARTRVGIAHASAFLCVVRAMPRRCILRISTDFGRTAWQPCRRMHFPEHDIHRVLGNQARNAFRALETCPSSNNAIALVSGTDLHLQRPHAANEYHNSLSVLIGKDAYA